MKKILFLTFLLTVTVEAKEITLMIPDEEIAIVENIVVDAEQWIKDAWAGKLNNAKKRIIKKEIEISIKNNETLPAGEDAIIDKYLERPEGKSRKEIEAKEAGKKG